MPYKMFCDQCGDETTENFVSNRAIIESDGWRAEVMVRNPEKVWNKGILCEACLCYLLRNGVVQGKREANP